MTGVDSVAIKMAAGYNLLRPLEWQALSSSERFAMIKAHRVIFLSAGESVPTREALEWLAAYSSGAGVQ